MSSGAGLALGSAECQQLVAVRWRSSPKGSTPLGIVCSPSAEESAPIEVFKKSDREWGLI